MEQRNILDVKLLSSLEKVFADEEPKAELCKEGSMLCNEVFSLQAGYCWNGPHLKNVSVRVVSDLAPIISLRMVGLVSCEMPCYADHDDNVLRTRPGLFPDPLLPLPEDGIVLLNGQWRSIWITVKPEGRMKPGIYPIELIFAGESGEQLSKSVFHLEILDAWLPRQSLIHTEWLHTDCLATWYGVEVFSDRYWELVEQYIKTAAEHGINMILTPVFTPPLDTVPGGERPTVQLVDVEKSGNHYKFGFDKLKRWVELCRSNGIEYFEISHLFTQWGAKHAPKIVAVENGAMKRIFGWETDAAGSEYAAFLRRFIPELIGFIKDNGLQGRAYFHISDEPRPEHDESYKVAGGILEEYLEEFPVIDALSDYAFYEKGLVKNPIPSSNHIEEFLEHQVPDLWTYYCCSQYKEVSNRFFCMPSARNRILGMQLYKYNITGFLHWGYNFWYSQYSRYPVDPFRVTDAGYAFPGGDAFLVYPGKDGPLESVRMEVFFEALQDMRALQLAEELLGREAVLGLMEEGLEKPITFSKYPKDARWLLSRRERLNREIARAWTNR